MKGKGTNLVKLLGLSFGEKKKVSVYVISLYASKDCIARLIQVKKKLEFFIHVAVACNFSFAEGT